MKKKILLLMGIFSVGIILHAQVGINTQNPQGLLHIDGKGDTSGSNNITDDVIINNQGNIGIGTLSPMAKVHINTSGTPAMRIADGTQGLDKILRSDADGNASWVKQPATDGAIHRMEPAAAINYGSTETLLMPILVNETGNFLVTIRWWGKSNAKDTNGVTAAYFYLLEGSNTANSWSADKSNVQDLTEYRVIPPSTSGTFTGAFCFATSLYASAKKDSYLKIYIKVSIGGPWVIGSVGDHYKFNPSIIVYRV